MGAEVRFVRVLTMGRSGGIIWGERAKVEGRGEKGECGIMCGVRGVVRE